MNHDPIDPLGVTEPEVEAAIVLAGEAHAAVDDAALLDPRGLKNYFGADRAAIAPRAGERELDPVIGAVRPIAIEHGGLILVRDDHVERAAVRQVGERHG